MARLTRPSMRLLREAAESLQLQLGYGLDELTGADEQHMRSVIAAIARIIRSRQAIADRKVREYPGRPG